MDRLALVTDIDVDEHLKEHHRNVNGGPARAAVFGASDGLVTNVSLVLGVAGAQANRSLVFLAGMAGLLAGAFSMAAGEYISMKAQQELLQRELDMERLELKRNPVEEEAELAAMYVRRGIDATLAKQLAADVMTDPDRALQAHAREEMGVDPDDLGSPWGAAGSSFAAFCVGAVLPLLPWFFFGGNGAVLASAVIGSVSALVIGVVLGHFTGRSKLRSGLRQLFISALAASVTYAVGSLIGVELTP